LTPSIGTRKFLSPVRKLPTGHGSPHSIGADESKVTPKHKQVFTGLDDAQTGVQNSFITTANTHRSAVSDDSQFYSSWSPPVTSAMSVSIHHGRWINLSVQFILDGDPVRDVRLDRPALNSRPAQGHRPLVLAPRP
jgi:hypothetical protein